MVVLVAPVVVLAAASLKLRHRTAARAGAAVLIPLVLLGGVLSALGVSPHQTFRAEYVPFFWFVATVMLASWAGWLATRLFRPNSRKPRQM
jgi:hypothetical protein